MKQSTSTPKSEFYQVVTPDGKPAAGLTVCRYGSALDGGTQFGTPEVTDAQGRLPKAPPYFTGVLALPKDGPLTVFSFPKTEAPLRLASRATELTLRLTEGHGKPLAGVTVTLRPVVQSPSLSPAVTQKAVDGTVAGWASGVLPEQIAPRLSTVTGADGSLRIANLPQQTSFTVAVSFPDKWTHLLSGLLTLSGAPRTDVQISLPRDGVIEGRVFHKRDGKPVVGAQVILIEPSEGGGALPFSGDTKTDEEGRYRFTNLLIGTYGVGAGDSNWLPAPNRRQAALTLSNRRLRYDVALIQAATLVGTVVGADGRPVHGAILWAEQPRQGGSGQQTDIHGVARQTLRPGTYTVGWSPHDRSGAERDVRRVTFKEGETQTLNLGPPPRARFALAPSVDLIENNGRRVPLAALRGKIVVLALTSSGFEDRLVALDALVRQWANRNVVGLVVNMQPEKPLETARLGALRFFQDTGHKLQEAFAVTGYPLTFVIGRDGAFLAQPDFTPDAPEMEALLRAATRT